MLLDLQRRAQARGQRIDGLWPQDLADFTLVGRAFALAARAAGMYRPTDALKFIVGGC